MKSINRGKTGNWSFAVIFCVGGLVCLAAYCILISLYNRLSKDPIIFFASLIISLFVTIGVCFAIFRLTKKSFCGALLFLLGLSYFLALILVSVFGPTFIDRSISYHIAFYAAEEGVVKPEELQETFSNDIFNKRIHDALVSDILKEDEDGSLIPTTKCKLLYCIMRPIGELTNSMGNYYEMKGLVNNK